MIPGDTSCFSDGSHLYNVAKDIVSSSSLEETNLGSASLLYSLSLFKDKVHQLQSLATIFISPNQAQSPDSTALAVANMGTLIQEIIVTASSMMFACQQMALGSTFHTTATATATTADELQHHHHHHHHHHQDHGLKLAEDALSQPSCDDSQDLHVKDERRQGFYFNETLDWYNESYKNCSPTVDIISSNNDNVVQKELPNRSQNNGVSQGFPSKNYDIIELDAEDLLAKYTHYCQVCGKGFKRDANLRKHMRAHGDEYKSIAALSNPMKNNGSAQGNSERAMRLPIKYSCPQEGCRWNRKHAKFQPLKSMICVKNHYKRSHCPKMYVCKRCNRKEFSVLSDLRTHEKHCGDLKWQCSCGTTFSRKDKLMGHVALFIGHTPVINSSMKIGKFEQQVMQMQ